MDFLDLDNIDLEFIKSCKIRVPELEKESKEFEKNDTENKERTITKIFGDDRMTIRDMIINLFSAENFLSRLYSARSNILTQSKEGKQSFFLFDYPNIGWFQYNHRNIDHLYKLASTKTGQELYNVYINEKYDNSIRLHAIASLLIKRKDMIVKLFDTVKRARDAVKQPRKVILNFENPFSDVYPLENNYITLQNKEIIHLQNLGFNKKFKPFIPLLPSSKGDESLGVKYKNSNTNLITNILM